MKRTRKHRSATNGYSFEVLEPRFMLSCSHVVIDAGHGGSSSADNLPGSSWNNATSASGLLEKDLTLELAQQVEQAMLAKGFKVSMTRTQDVNVSGANRAAVAKNLVDKDTEHVFFLSLHFNGFDGSVRGTETIYADNPRSTNFNLDQDRAYAGIIQQSLMAALTQFGGESRGVKPDRTARQFPLSVLSDSNFGNTADRQAVLTALAEIDFIDNPSVDAILSNPAQRKRFFGEIARALAAGMETAQRTFCDQPDVVEVIDRSGSMDSDGKIIAAKTAASQFVRLMEMGDKIGVVSYSSSASLEYALNEISSQAVRDEAIVAINGISTGGNTSIGAGVKLADAELDRFPDDSNRVMIVLTDGRQNTSPDPISVVNSDVDQNIRVFTIGLGADADNDLLRSLASARNGEFFFSPTNTELNRIYQLIRSRITGELKNFDGGGVIKKGEVKRSIFTIDPSATSTTLGLTWPGSDLDLEVISPSGKIYNRRWIDQQPEATLDSGGNFETLRIDLPEAGEWIARTRAIDVPEAGLPYQLLIQSESILKTDVESTDEQGSSKSEFSTGDLVNLLIKVEDERAVSEAAVFANVSSPTGSTIRLRLVDNGTQGDAVAGDGIYSTQFNQLFDPGIYSVHYDISGKSSFDFEFSAVDSAQLFVSGDPVPTNTAPRFTNIYSRGESVGNTTTEDNLLAIARFIDLDVDQSYTATVSWGDGSREQVPVKNIGERWEIRANHQYSVAGRLPVSVTVNDGLDSTTITTNVYISGVDLIGNTLFVVGDEDNDLVQFYDRGEHFEVFTKSQSRGTSLDRFELSKIARVRVYSGGGHDRVKSYSAKIPLQAWLGSGNDTATGSKVDDFILGEEGRDTIFGREGNDRINAGHGNDIVFGGLGDDFLVGGFGDDRLFGGNGNDSLFGQVGQDRIFGQRGNDMIQGGAGNDILHGNTGQDELHGHQGEDRIYGEVGQDRLFGGPDADKLFGGSGDDFLDGGMAIDLLVGGGGSDQLVNAN